MTNRKPHMPFDWCQNQRPWITLNGPYGVCCTHMHLSELIDRPVLAAKKRSLVVSWIGASNDSGIVDNSNFQFFVWLCLQKL